MDSLRKLIIATLIILAGHTSFAGQEYATIDGSFVEKATAEIVIVQKVGDKTVVLAQYYKDQQQDCFSLRFPLVTEGEYVMKVLLYKQGARRMELENVLVYPVTPVAGGVQTFAIKPSVFNQSALTGITAMKTTKPFSTLTISGQLKKWYTGGPLTLSKVVDGQLQPVQTVNLQKNNTAFCFHVPVTAEGFYYIGTLGWRKRIYAKPKDSMQVDIDGTTQELQWVHTTKENELLTQWEVLIEPITDWGYERTIVQADKLNLESFTRNYQQLQPAIKNFKTLVSGANNTFNNLLRTVMAVDNQYAALKLLFRLSAKKIKGYTAVPKEFSGVPVYFRDALLREPVTTMRLMQVGEGKDYVDLLTKFSLGTLDENKRARLSAAERIQVMIKAIPNDTLRAVFLNEQLSQTEVNNLREFKEVFDPLQKYATTPAVKKKYKEVYAQFIGDTAFIGKPAWDFTLPDTAGKMVSMKDFKGKVVLIDVWATWCGPCKAEFPFLKAIEEEYKDNGNMVFVGISTDKIGKKDAWLQLIQKEKLGGVQLLDDFGKDFARKYGINSIPRFMLIDKQGRWTEVRCPRPSDKENLKKYLNEALNK